MKHHFSVALWAIAFLTIAACSKGDSSSTAQTPAADSAASSAKSADPCNFLTKDDLQSALGYTLEAGVQTQGEPSCRFVSSSDDTVTIALPTANVTEADFNSWREMAGASAQPVTGVGDAAYFWGPRLYARVGVKTFTISIAARDLTPELRSGLTTLGQTGAARIQ